MISIRNITDDAVALGITKFPSTEDILSRLQSDSSLKKERVFVSKGDWGKHLGICQMTIIRWEQNIIKPNRSFRVNYWDMKGNTSRLKRFQSGKSMGYRLDYFQRFVLSLIRAIKAGAFTQGNPMKYDYEVVAWLENTEKGQQLKRFFDRDAFEVQTTKNNRRKSA